MTDKTKTKVVRRKPKAKKEPVKPDVISYGLSQLYYEIDTVKMQMNMLSDDDLYDYCIPHIEMYKHVELDRLYPKLAEGRTLEKSERKALEAFFILANTQLFLIE